MVTKCRKTSPLQQLPCEMELIWVVVKGDTTINSCGKVALMETETDFFFLPSRDRLGMFQPSSSYGRHQVVVLWLSEFLFIDFVARSMCDLIRRSFEVEEVIIAGGKVSVVVVDVVWPKIYLELSNNRTTFQRIDRVRVLEKINAGD